MLEFHIKRQDKYNQFGIYLDNKHRALPHIRLLCQELVTIKDFTITHRISTDINFLEIKRTKQIYGFPLTMGKFTWFIFPHNIHIN